MRSIILSRTLVRGSSWESVPCKQWFCPRTLASLVFSDLYAGGREGITVTMSLLLNLLPSPSSFFQEVMNKCSIIWISSACVLNHPAVSWERRATETDSLLKNYVLQKFFFMISLHSSSRSHGRQFIIREYLSTPDLSWIISLRFLIRCNLIPIIYFFASSSLFAVSIPDDFF